MTFSRRQLYAMGEPLGDSATYRKADGGLILGGGGGGGGGSPATQTNVADLPDWAKGPAQDVLAKGQALTDISANPYQGYQGQRVAGFNKMQNTAMSNVASPGAWGKNVQGYMSPYMNDVVAREQQTARENAGAQMGALNAQAAQKGAFGGSGIALQRAAQDRGLQRQLGDIQASGLQTAFQQGTQQANLANQQQMQYGSMQQQLEQQGLNNAYQDFLNQKNYPYQQLSYMSNLIRGTPMGMNNTSQVYQGAPTGLQTIGALGAGAYGLSKLMAKDGGLMESYADGGEVKGYSGKEGSVTSQGNIKNIVHDLDTDEDLQRALRAAQARGDMDQIEAVQSELAMRASLRGGLASGVTPEMANNVIRAAGGGILAFAARGEVDSSAKSTDEELATSMTDADIDALLARGDEEGGGTVTNNPQIGQIANSLLSYTPRQFTPSQISALDRYNFQKVSAAAGPNEAAKAYQKSITAQGEAIPRDFEMAKGLAALQAIPAFLQPGGAARGLGAGAAKWGAGYGDAMATKRASEQHLAKAQFDLTDAQRKERQGLHKDAQALTASYVKNQLEGEKLAQLAKAKAGELLVNQQKAQALASRGAGGSQKDFIVGPAAYEARIREQHSDWTEAQIKAEAFRQFQQGKGPGYQGASEKLDATVVANADKAWEDMGRSGRKAWAKENGIDVSNPAWLGAAQKAYQQDYATRARPSAEPKVTPVPVEEKPTQPGQPGIAAAAKASFGNYEPDKYDYRINPDSGKLQRKAK